MLTQDVVDAIKAAIDEKTNNDEKFTAYDISKAVQSKGIRQRHLYMRDQIHTEMDNRTDYEKKLINIPNKGQAWLYLPEYTDTDDYQIDNTNDSSSDSDSSDDDMEDD